MQAIRNDKGIITHYQGWKGDNYETNVVFDNILAIQQAQLCVWKTKLNTACYNDLLMVVTLHNQTLNKLFTDAYTIKRGDSLSTFVANWAPDKQITEIYW